MKKKVLLTKPFFEKDINYIKSGLLPEVELITPENYELETLLSLSKDVEVFLGPNLLPTLLENAKNLELIQIPWTGVDKLELSNLKGYDFVLCNSHSNSLAVAEHSVALALSLLKKIPYHHNELKNGIWNRPKADASNEVSPFSISVKDLNIGLLGYGSIAAKIHKLLLGFECDFYVCSKSPKDFSKEKRISESFLLENIDDFLQHIDILFICLPLTSETNQLLDSSKLKYLKGGYLVNTARGEIINEEDLFELLSNKTIKGAAIDTWTGIIKDGEKPSSFGFEKLNNVILSPHRAGMIEGALPHLDDAITNINNLCQGLPLINIVDINKKY